MIVIKSLSSSLKLCHIAILGDTATTLPTACATTDFTPPSAWASLQNQSYEVGGAMAYVALDMAEITPTDAVLPDVKCASIIA